MAFEDVWNSTYEGLPADNENISLGAGRIQDLKVNIRERANIDHSWGDTLDNGQHNQISFNISTNNPATSGTNGYLYTKTVSSNTELFWEDSSGNVIQLTKSGALNTQSFPSGTVMTFLQAAPPTGWSGTPAYNDQLLRLTDGVGGGGGGSWSISGFSYSGTTGTTAADLAAHTHGITDPGHVHGVTDPGHTHTVGLQLANSYGGGSNGAAGSGSINTGSATNGISVNSATSGISTQSTGAGGGHNHTYSGSVSNDSTWRPSYINVCPGIKN